MDGVPGIPPIEIDECLQGRLDRSRDQRATLEAARRQQAEEGQPASLPQVEILSARGLTEAAWAGFGRSQRFCTCEIPGKPHSEVQTPYLDDTQAPLWNHKMEIQDYDFGDRLQFQIVAVHPKYRKWRTVLGSASLQCHDFVSGAGFDDELELVNDCGRKSEAYLRVRVFLPKKEEQVAKPMAKQKTKPTRPGQAEPRPVAVPSILEDCIKEAKAGAERRRQGQDSSTAVAQPEEEAERCVEDLPPGWEAAWDKTYERYYFYNHELGLSSWEWPEERRSKAKRPDRKGRKKETGL